MPHAFGTRTCSAVTSSAAPRSRSITTAPFSVNTRRHVDAGNADTTAPGGNTPTPATDPTACHAPDSARSAVGFPMNRLPSSEW